MAVESTTGIVLSAEMVAEGATDPEEMGKKASELLLEEISQGGCVDAVHQSMCLLYMVLCPEDVSKLKLGKLTDQSIRMLRNIKVC